MSRELKKKLKLFVEGDTEENYFKQLKEKNNLDITYKPVNLRGGGYSNFIREIIKSGDLGFIAVFVIVDLDKIDEEKENFFRLYAYCKEKNKKGKVPYFLIGTNKDFEFFSCCHSPKYTGQSTDQFIKKEYGYKSVEEFKGDKKIYEVLNKGERSYKVALDKLKHKKPYICNQYKLEKKDMQIKIIDTGLFEDALSYPHSNMQELFEIIGIKLS